MAITTGIPATHTTHHGTDYGKLWDTLCSPVYRVLDEEGGNVASGCVRHLLGHHWLYVDETDGYQVMEDDDAERLMLDDDEG